VRCVMLCIPSNVLAPSYPSGIGGARALYMYAGWVCPKMWVFPVWHWCIIFMSLRMWPARNLCN
jgi:hypothetical protein